MRSRDDLSMAVLEENDTSLLAGLRLAIVIVASVTRPHGTLWAQDKTAVLCLANPRRVGLASRAYWGGFSAHAALDAELAVAAHVFVSIVVLLWARRDGTAS